MSVSQTTAATIVTAATTDLIAKADSIVVVCVGAGCNTNPATTLKIKEELSSLARRQAHLILKGLGVRQSSVIGFQIETGYLALAAAVSATYSYQCGASTVTSNSCTFNGSNVVLARHNLQALLNRAIGVDLNRIIVSSLLLIGALIFVALFLIFMIVGTVEFVLEAGLRRNKTVTKIQKTASTAIPSWEAKILPEQPPSPIISASTPSTPTPVTTLPPASSPTPTPITIPPESPSDLSPILSPDLIATPASPI